MPPAFILTLREGLDALLIVAVTLAYLKRTGRSNLVRAVHRGMWISVGLSIGAATAFQQAANQALWDGILAMAAAILGGWLLVHVWRAASVFESPHHTLDRTAVRDRPLAYVGMFLFTLLMITREGMETVIVMKTLLFQTRSVQAIGFAHSRDAPCSNARLGMVPLWHTARNCALARRYAAVPFAVRCSDDHLWVPRADRG